MALVKAHELTQTFDCAVPGCRDEAEVTGGLCLFSTRAAREQARDEAAHAGKLETGVLALGGSRANSTPSSAPGTRRSRKPAVGWPPAGARRVCREAVQSREMSRQSLG